MQGLRLEIDLLGGFQVRAGGSDVPDGTWRRRKPAALLKLLALAPAGRRHREELTDLLWPDLEAAAGAANLRKALHQARAGLEGAATGAGSLVVSDGDFLALEQHGLAIDVVRFRTSLALARQAGSVDGYAEALAAYGGELLPEDRYDDWAIRPRRELHLEYLGGVTELVALLEARGAIGHAIDAARRLVAAEPAREESHALLIRLYALAGRRVDALRQYELLTRILDEELGVEPGPDVQRLHEEIRARRADEPELNAELWERVGELRVLSGDAVGAAKAFTQAVDLAEDDTARDRMRRKCAQAWLVQHRPDLAEPLLDAVRTPSDPAEEGRLALARANVAWESGDLDRAGTLAARALELATVAGDNDDVAAAEEALALVSHLSGQWLEGLGIELQRLARDDGGLQLARIYDVHHCLGQFHLYGDGFGEVEGHARVILDRAEEANAVRAQAFAWCLLGESLLLQARWEEADACLTRSCEIHASLGTRSGGLAWQRRAELAVGRGATDDVPDLLRQASAIATVSPMARHLWGRIYATRGLAAIEEGDPTEAVRAVEAAAAAAARYGACPSCSALLNPVAAEAYAELGDVAAAQAYAEAAAVVAEMFGSSAWRAMADSAAGSAARATGDLAAARRHLAAAGAGYEAAGQPYWAARSGRLHARISE